MLSGSSEEKVEQLNCLLGKEEFCREQRQEGGVAVNTVEMASHAPEHFDWKSSGGVATVTLNGPERKNPLTFDSYAELRDTFRGLAYAEDVKAVVLTGSGGNFSSGGDVQDIIGPLTEMDMGGLLRFTRMTGDLVKAMRACPQPVVAAVDGVCVGAGAAIAMASDLRLGTPEAKVAFLFTRVGLAGCDMGACAMLPRIIGQGRASELLFTGRSMAADEAERWGFFNRLVEQDLLLDEATELANALAEGPTFAHGMTKTMLNQEWNMGLDAAIESEAQAQAICMQTRDFERAYRAFMEKRQPDFEGN
jgi:enoyl-CoA hydratase/carnithine racemase